MAHAIVPKTDCPHVGESLKLQTKPASIDVINAQCSDCSDSSENWICVHCWNVSCSRYVKGHAAKHFESTKHSIAISFSDLSVWCYKCESYIKHQSFSALLQELEKSKEESEDEQEHKHKAGDEPVGSSDDEEGGFSVDQLSDYLGKAGLNTQPAVVREKVLPELTLAGVANFIKSGKAKNIIVLTGAGISVAAGIPDFRTPGTGLYDNLQKYNLPHPTAVFELDYFRQRPQAFYTLAKELYPGQFEATDAHWFIRFLHHKQLLLRNFTQNIDTLEDVAGIPASALVFAHGSFQTSSCIDCHVSCDNAFVKECVFSGTVPKCKACGGLVKPDIVFFGESLPQRFFGQLTTDFPKCDLLIVMGTSLQVQPFASLVHRVGENVPRLLINREVVGKSSALERMLGLSQGFRFGENDNYRDVGVTGGDLQEGVRDFVKLLGWTDEFNAFKKAESKPLIKK